LQGYRLVEGPPALADYLSLRLRTGLSPKTAQQGEAALPMSPGAGSTLDTASSPRRPTPLARGCRILAQREAERRIDFGNLAFESGIVQTDSLGCITFRRRWGE
jgi:hypothetical protein